MTFNFTEEQLMCQDLARELSQKEFRPYAHEFDETAQFPKENIEKLAAAGLMGLNISEE